MAGKGTKYKCDECGIVVVVDKSCGCSPCDLVCCNVPMREMRKVKPKAKAKVKPKAKSKTKAKPKSKTKRRARK